MTKRTLRRRGYAIKKSTVGWWVDGKYGYLVAGYHSTEVAAVAEASKAIVAATGNASKPVWFI